MKKYKTHYDAIPPRLLHGTVLDVGCGDGSNQRMSKNWHLLEAGYCTSIDIEIDLFKYEPEHPFDTVLAIHVIEHIPIEQWWLMFERLQSWVKPHGHLVIGTPYMQSPAVYKRFKGPENQRHVVFGINELMLSVYLFPGFEAIRYLGPYSQSLMVIWRKKQ